MRRIITLSILVGLLLVVHEQPTSHAYTNIRIATSSNPSSVGIKVAWDLSNNSRPNINDGRIQYVIGENGSSDSANFNGPFTEFEAIQRSFRQWRDLLGSNVDFEFTGTASAPSDDAGDDVNTIFWDEDDLDSTVFAVTITSFDTVSGEILDADLVFNDGDFVWDTLSESGTTGVAGRSYIEQIAVHEIGHFLGLDHSFINNSTLFPFTDSGAINYISLHEDDVAPIITEYPDPDPPASDNVTVSGNVTSSGTGRLGVIVTLADVDTGEAVISALTDRTTTTTPPTAFGDYTIENVPPGNYYVIAAPIDDVSNLGGYYSSSFTSFLATARGVTSGTNDTPTILKVPAGVDQSNIDIAVSSVASPFEPNETPAAAAAITLGDALGAVIENSSDLDFFSFAVTTGETFRVHVHSDSLGQPLNPELILFDTDMTTKLVSGASGDFGQAFYDAQARDIENAFYGLEGPNFDAFIEFTATSTGTYYLCVAPSSSSGGDYMLTTYSDLSDSTVDVNATTIEADIVGIEAGGADFTITITPTNTSGSPFPLSGSGALSVDLIDVTNGNTILNNVTSTNGPWTFTVTPPATAQSVTYGAVIDAVTMNAQLSIDFFGTLNTATSTVDVLQPSLVADGLDDSRVEVALWDTGGRLVVDNSLTVTLTTSAGELDNGTTTGTTLDAAFEAATGYYVATVTSPTSGSTLSVSAEVNSQSLGSDSTDLTLAASSSASAAPSGSSGGGGGGCALPAQVEGSWFTWVIVLVGLLALANIRRRVMIKNER